MKIHVVQREGTRYFSRFSDISERDRLVVELRVEDKNGGTISIDLTEALIEEYSKHPEIGKVSAPGPVSQILSLEPIKPLVTRRSKTVSPIDRADPKTTDILSKVREAQLKAAAEKKQKQAELAAARDSRLAAAREAKAKKQRAESGKRKVESGKQKAKTAPAPKPKKPAATKATAKLTATQKSAIKKIGKVLAKEEKQKSESPRQKPQAAERKGKTPAPAKASARKPKPALKPTPRSTRTKP